MGSADEGKVHELNLEVRQGFKRGAEFVVAGTPLQRHWVRRSQSLFEI